MTARRELLVTILLAGFVGVAVAPAAAFDGPTQTTGGKKAAPTKPAAAAKPGQPAAQGNDSAPDKGKAAENAARILELGIKAYQGGDTKNALKAFDTALQSGALNHQQMAHALYYRGLTYRKDGKPGLAISDLTAAIWLKDGLTTTERQEAARHRVAAYGEAGIGDVPDFTPPTSEPASATASAATAPGTTGATGVQTASAAPVPPAASSSSSSSSGGFFSSISNFFTGGSSSTPAPAPAPASAPTSAPRGDEGVTTASLGESKPATPAVATSWSESVQPASAQGQPGAQPLPWASGSSAPAAPPAAAASVPAQSSETLPWASNANAPAAAASPPASSAAPYQPLIPSARVETAAVAPHPSAAKHTAARAPSGKYVMQVASVRSHEEADLLVAKLLTEHGGELGGRDPQVTEAVIGNMGTFYQVRVGPYADAKEPKALCGVLGNGFDCLVVTNN